MEYTNNHCLPQLNSFYRLKNFSAFDSMANELFNMRKAKRKPILKTDFWEILLPFYLLNTISGVRKYNVKYKSAQKINLKNFFLTIISNFLFALSFYLVTQFADFRVAKNCMYLMYIQYQIFYVLISFFILISRSDNVQLLGILKELHGRLTNDKDLKKLKILAWLSAMYLFVGFVTLSLFKYFYDPTWYFSRSCLIFISIFFDIQIMEVVIYIGFLCYTMRTWREKIEEIKLDGVDDGIPLEKETVLKELLKILKLIKTAWKLIQKTSGFIVNVFYTVLVAKFVCNIKKTSLVVEYLS